MNPDYLLLPWTSFRGPSVLGQIVETHAARFVP